MINKLKNKEKNRHILREAKPKNRFGLKIPSLKMPHDDLITPPSQTRQPLKSDKSSESKLSVVESIAPTKNFQKVPNSLTKESIPAGLFKGKSKQLYDSLYALTRGAIEPKRSVRISKSKIMKIANIGSRITFDSNIKHLQVVGLIKETIFTGEHLGNEFEVFLPEEAQASVSSQTSLTRHTSHAQKLDTLVSPETRHTSQTSKPIETTTYTPSKTSLKTKSKNDDDSENAFSDFFEKLEKANIKITGKKPSLTEREKWSEVAELLVIELELAAARTDSVSSVPAFLKEVLRRKLEKKSISPKGKSSAKASPKGVSRSLQVGKPSSIRADEEADWEKENMSAEEKQKTLLIMRDRIKEGHKDLVMSMEQAYSKSDWQWLTDKLEERSKSGS